MKSVELIYYYGPYELSNVTGGRQKW